MDDVLVMAAAILREQDSEGELDGHGLQVALVLLGLTKAGGLPDREVILDRAKKAGRAVTLDPDSGRVQ